MERCGTQRKTRILVVDDERIIADTLTAILIQAGYDTCDVHLA